jgi:hypothetical protein
VGDDAVLVIDARATWPVNCRGAPAPGRSATPAVRSALVRRTVRMEAVTETYPARA